MTRLPDAPSQVIDRGRALRFTFDGRSFSAFEGDTIASALAAAGMTTFSRSFKYHRRRGLLCVAGRCPNCLVQVGDEPNVRACQTPVTNGMRVTSQNAWPSLDRDVMSLTALADRFLPVGFYYKTFMRPRALWPLYERALRRATGLGRVDPASEPRHPAKIYKHADVAVLGGGPAGIAAARAASSAGARVVLLESEPALGGHLRWTQPDFAGIDALDQVETLTNTTALGIYDDLWIGATMDDQLVKLRARAVVIATGAHEVPALFENNDLPGVMLGSGALRLARLWGVRPGTRAVVVSARRQGLQTALDLRALGVEIAAVVDARPQPDPDLVAALAESGITVRPESMVTRAGGRGRVAAAEIGWIAGGTPDKAACDLIAISADVTPANALLFQAGAKLAWDPEVSAFLPGELPPGVFAAGEVMAAQTLTDIERAGEQAGWQAAHFARPDVMQPLAAAIEIPERAPQVAYPVRPATHDFVCWCEDVTSRDIQTAIAEGFDSIELLKRYSTISMGPCQGKMCGANAIRLCAQMTGQTVAQTGTTTSRPPIDPVAMGTLAGRVMEPVRVTPVHAWHVAQGARMMNAGLWKRPEHYGDPAAEARAVRERVGIIDVSTLGKLQITGPDVARLLERLYTNRWQNLAVGRARYGVMVNDEGVVMDDGVTARLADDHYYMTNTTGGAGGVYEWIEWWLQSGWNLDAQVTDVAEAWAAINVAGPRARDTLASLTDLDLSNEAFPYMGARQAQVAGVPAVILRIGFTGELSYEIHVPSGYGQHVWQALMVAGSGFGITPFGVEAQRILRLEKGHILIGQDTDALTNPYEASMGWAVKLDKDDFLGGPSLLLQSQGVEKRLVGFEMDTLPEEMCQIVTPGDGPLGLSIIGRVTSARHSPTLGRVIGLCWLPSEMAKPGTEFTARARGELLRGRVVDVPFYDPQGARLRM